jgi:hypothetical protein
LFLNFLEIKKFVMLRRYETSSVSEITKGVKVAMGREGGARKDGVNTEEEGNGGRRRDGRPQRKEGEGGGRKLKISTLSAKRVPLAHPRRRKKAQ